MSFEKNSDQRASDETVSYQRTANGGFYAKRTPNKI